MKNLSHLTMFLGAVLGLACVGLGQRAQGQDTLVNIVLNATKQYVDNVNAATAAGYSPVLGCVSGSDHGAMGIH